MEFKIVFTKGNRTNSLPAHWDIFAPGSEESIATIWDSEAMADMFVMFLKAWADKSKKVDQP